MRVRVLAFAQLRELLGAQIELELAPGTTLQAVWDVLVPSGHPGVEFRAATRFARNGELCAGATALRDGDEVALLPPVGGG